MKPAIAKVITLPAYNTTLTLARMQRVAYTMERLGGLPKNFDVKSMYYPMAGAAAENTPRPALPSYSHGSQAHLRKGPVLPSYSTGPEGKT